MSRRVGSWRRRRGSSTVTRHESEILDATLVVVSYNSEGVLRGFFDSLSEGTGDATFEVVVVDNASSDDSIGVAQELAPEATVVAMTRNVGYAAAINAGVMAARPSRAIFVLNDDMRLGPDSLPLLLEGLEKEGVGVVAPRLSDGEGRLLTSLRREPTVLRVLGEALLGGERSGRFKALGEVVMDPGAYDRRTVADWASGCALLISRDCWDDVGPWDESFFLYAEDIDYALRCRDAGYVLQLVPTAQATHLVGPSHENPRLWSMSVWNRYRLYHRRHGAISAMFFRIALIINEALRALAGRTTHRAALRALLVESQRPIEVR